MDLRQVPIIHMGIDLGGGDRGVPEKCLHGSDVSSFFYKRGCKTVPEGMRGYLLFYPCKSFIFMHKFLDTISTQSLAVAIIGQTDKEIVSIIASAFEIHD
jgi:hypothetical protein